MCADARRVSLRRGPRYIEVDVDVGSSKTAANVVGLVQGALKSLVIDIAVLLEGHSTVRILTSCASSGRPDFIVAGHQHRGATGGHCTVRLPPAHLPAGLITSEAIVRSCISRACIWPCLYPEFCVHGQYFMYSC